MQTAIAWLSEQILNPNNLNNIRLGGKKVLMDLLEQAKEMEKDQIIDAWRNGDNDSMYSPKDLDKQAEEYYNETYSKRYENTCEYSGLASVKSYENK